MSHHTADPVCPLCSEKIPLAHPVLHAWWVKLKHEFPDAHISWTYRGEEDQNRFLEEGKTRVAWPHSAHNKQPSRAMDLFQIRPDKVAAWPPGWFVRISDWLKAEGAPIEWGGTWKSIGDGDHFELVKSVE